MVEGHTPHPQHFTFPRHKVKSARKGRDTKNGVAVPPINPRSMRHRYQHPDTTLWQATHNRNTP